MMRRFNRIGTVFCISILFCVSIIFFLLLCSKVDADYQDRVTFVYDGDTVKLSSGKKIRLAGIDTPEREPQQYYYKEAKLHLCRIVERGGFYVSIHTISTDHYGRKIADLFDKNGKSISERMLADGMASFYYHSELSEKMMAKFLSIQRKAIKKRNGMWKKLLASPLASQKYVGNRNSMRFFSMSCVDWKNIGRRNRVLFQNLEEAYSAGYAPARPCKIFPLASYF